MAKLLLKITSMSLSNSCYDNKGDVISGFHAHSLKSGGKFEIEEELDIINGKFSNNFIFATFRIV